MKTHKTGINILLIVTILSLILVGCGNDPDTESSNKKTSESSSESLVIDACAGYDSAAVLLSDGSAKKWGDDTSDSIGDEAWSDLKDIECGWTRDSYIGLKADGTIVCDSNYHSDVGQWTDIIEIGMGDYPDSPIAGLKKDGTVVHNLSHDKNYSAVNEWSDVKDISVGDSSIAAITNSGKVLVAGDNDHGACNVDDWDNLDIVQVSTGGGYTAGLKADGTIVTTELIGDDLVAEKYIHEVDKWTGITQICAGLTQIAGITNEGTVVVAHTDAYNYDVSGWENVTELISGNDVLIGITNDGKVLYTGNENQY